MDSSTGGTENATAQTISGSINDYEPTANQCSQRNATKTDSVAPHKSQTYDRSEATMERRTKEEGVHEREIVVARAVLTYLQTKNPTIFRKATAITTEDYHGWLQQHSSPGDMECLKAVVGEQYWSRAKRHLEEHLRRANDNKGHKAVTSFNLQSSAPAVKVSDQDTLHEVNGELYPVFAHILLRYLDSQNRALCNVAKDMIDDCMARSQRKEEGYESITASMRLQVKPAIGDFYWKQAETIHAHYQRQRKEVAVKTSPPTSRLSPTSPQELQSTRALEGPSADINDHNDYTMYDPTPVEKLRRLQPEEEADMEGIDAALDFLCRN